MDKENVIWFCDQCGAANKINNKLDCESCNAPMVKECLVFNIENFQAVVPIDQARGRVIESPYFISGGLSSSYYSEWK